MIFTLSEQSPNSIYHLMTQTIIPRPVAWILSKNEDGSHNLAPFSYFTALSSDPAILAISIGKKSEGELKDTRKNILERKDFVVHIASSRHAEAVTKTAASLDYQCSELELVNEELAEFESSPLPRLQSCQIAFYCELYDKHYLGPNEQAIIYGLIKSVYVEDSAVRCEGKRVIVDAKKIDPLSRLGGSQYGFLGEISEVKRPS